MANNSNKLLDEKNNVIQLISTSKIFIRILATGIAILYGWLKFKGLHISPIINQISTELILKVSLIIYYFSWVFGTTTDGDDQQMVFQKALNKGKVPTRGSYVKRCERFDIFINGIT